MENFINQMLFGYYPYIAVTICVLGSLYRYKFAQYHWRTGSSMLLRKKGMVLGSNLFHIGIILLLLGHFVGLLTPHFVYVHFISASTKQILAMTAGGIFGTICFVGMCILVYRRLFDDRVRAQSTWGDIIILLLLYVQLILGLFTIPVSAQDISGGDMMSLAQWAQHIVTFRSGAADFILQENIIFKLHIFLGLTIFLVFPFTRLVHVMSVPVNYFFRDGYQIIRQRP